METFLQHLGSTGLSTVRDVLPIVVIILGFQLLVIRRRIPRLAEVSVGFVYVLAGMTLFLVGLQEGLFPLGKLMAHQLTDPDFILPASGDPGQVAHWVDYMWVYVFAAALGFSTTIAEPALIAVAVKANDVSGGSIGANSLRIAVAIGVALGIALGSHRIITGTPLQYYIVSGYILVLIQTVFAPKIIIGLAYDSGGVTTSTVTVPLVTALGLGLASSVPGRSPLIDGFGLIAFASLFPMITVMAFAQITRAIETYGR